MKELIAYINSTVNNKFNRVSSVFPMMPAGHEVGYAMDMWLSLKGTHFLGRTMMT